MPDDATRDIGAHLREARERAGITLREIATATKISVPALEALERNDPARLPGGIFVRAFVRAYAREVGLDPEDAVGRFVARFPDTATGESAARYGAVPDQADVDSVSASGGVWRAVWWSLPILLVLAYFGLGGSLNWWGERGQSAAPGAETHAEPVPPGPAIPILTAPATIPPPEPTQAAPAGVQEGTAAPPTSTELRAETAPSPADDPRETSAREGRFQATLDSRGECWVRARSNGVIVFEGTLQAGERRDVDLWGSVSLTVGNAGVIDLNLNGQRARSLGIDGQVVTVFLNIDNLKSFLEAR